LRFSSGKKFSQKYLKSFLIFSPPAKGGEAFENIENEEINSHGLMPKPLSRG
jgi:hypothetical protein